MDYRQKAEPIAAKCIKLWGRVDMLPPNERQDRYVQQLIREDILFCQELVREVMTLLKQADNGQIVADGMIMTLLKFMNTTLAGLTRRRRLTRRGVQLVAKPTMTVLEGQLIELRLQNRPRSGVNEVWAKIVLSWAEVLLPTLAPFEKNERTSDGLKRLACLLASEYSIEELSQRLREEVLASLVSNSAALLYRHFITPNPPIILLDLPTQQRISRFFIQSYGWLLHHKHIKNALIYLHDIYKDNHRLLQCLRDCPGDPYWRKGLLQLGEKLLVEMLDDVLHYPELYHLKAFQTLREESAGKEDQHYLLSDRLWILPQDVMARLLQLCWNTCFENPVHADFEIFLRVAEQSPLCAINELLGQGVLRNMSELVENNRMNINFAKQFSDYLVYLSSSKPRANRELFLGRLGSFWRDLGDRMKQPYGQVICCKVDESIKKELSRM